MFGNIGDSRFFALQISFKSSLVLQGKVCGCWEWISVQIWPSSPVLSLTEQDTDLESMTISGFRLVTRPLHF
jgi:hypothetical protein